MRLIDADELLETLRENNAPYREDINRAIIYAPTIDPVRHGKWVSDRSLGGHCSNCGIECGSVEWGDDYLIKPTWNYCPNCGAKMDGGEE